MRRRIACVACYLYIVPSLIAPATERPARSRMRYVSAGPCQRMRGVALLQPHTFLHRLLYHRLVQRGESRNEAPARRRLHAKP